jgi:RNA polymerase sigma factor (sigma-70 family)
LSAAGETRSRRRYRPRLEALEALRLLDHGAAAALPLAGLIDLLEAPPAASPPETAPPALTASHAATATWDAALAASEPADWLIPESAIDRAAAVDPAQVRSGLDQMGRYLGRAWARAGIAAQQFDDCTQSVYAALLEGLGADGFDHLADAVGRHGVKQVLNWDSDPGPDFFRAVDRIKKSTQRARTFLPLDADAAGVDGSSLVDSGSSSALVADRAEALREAIATTLTPREAELIRATIDGRTPAEIAAAWGMAPKTVSNEKSRALSKLREALAAEFAA